MIEIKNRLRSDEGNAVTILGFAIIIFTLFLAIFIVDYSKAIYMKNLYTAYAHNAVTTAIKEQDIIGGLKASSAEKVVEEYMSQRNGVGNTSEAMAYSSNCNALGDYPKIEIIYDNQRKRGASGNSYYTTGGSLPSVTDTHTFYSHQYTVMQVNIVDITDNYYLGIFGNPCLEIKVSTGAMTSSHFDSDDDSE